MKTRELIVPGCAGLVGALIAIGAVVPASGAMIGTSSDADAGTGVAIVSAEDNDAGEGPVPREFDFRTSTPRPVFGAEGKQVSWLGVAIEEASDALTSQLRLDPGVGLVVTYVATNSPAAKAGLQENDLLVEFEGQALVHPAQLRKLVQVRKEGDRVKLVYYRGGEKKSVTVTLGRTTERAGWFDGGQDWRGLAPKLNEYLDAIGGDNEVYREQLKNLQRSLGELRIDSEQVQKEVRRSMEEARTAAANALRLATNDLKKFGSSARTLEELARGSVGVRKDAMVTVNSSGDSVLTRVKADDTGTYVVVANPRKRLTAHGPDGKLLFDGEVETPEQQAAVPKAIWEKVEELVNRKDASVKIMGFSPFGSRNSSDSEPSKPRTY